MEGHLSRPDIRKTDSALRYITAPYETVAQVFRDFVVPTPPGGNRRDDKKTQSVFEPVDEFNATQPTTTFHRESSFTDEQRPYVGAAIVALNTLAQGRLVGKQQDVPLPNFSQRVATRFRNDPPENHFGEAVMEATLDLYEDFGNHYPNLTPALNALSRVAGIEGTGIVLIESHGSLNRAITGELTEETIRQSYILDSENFVGLHPLHSEIKAYEIRCAAEALAKTLIRETNRAALTVANDEDIFEQTSRYAATQHEGIESVKSRLQTHIETVVEKAKLLYS